MIFPYSSLSFGKCVKLCLECLCFSSHTNVTLISTLTFNLLGILGQWLKFSKLQHLCKTVIIPILKDCLENSRKCPLITMHNSKELLNK